MKQPELGKKIAEIRKAKRLTQEELVDRCNISIRTIQRIESGEVTPRDYTLKTIFAALDYDLDALAAAAGPEPQQPTHSFTFSDGLSRARAIKHLKMAVGVGIAYFVLRFGEGIMEYGRFNHSSFFSNWGYATVKIGVALTFVFLMRGFVVLGGLVNSRLLKLSALMYMLGALVIIGLDMVSVFTAAVELEVVILLYSIGYGVLGLLFGFSLFRLPASLGITPKIAGVLELVAACFSLTIIFSFIGPFVLIPAELLELVLLFRVMEQLQQSGEAS